MGTVSYSNFSSVADWVESGWFVPNFTVLNSIPEKSIRRVPPPVVVDDGIFVARYAFPFVVRLGLCATSLGLTCLLFDF